MFYKIETKNQPKPIPLTKIQSSYHKLEKEMNKPPSEYDAIKKLVEMSESNIENNIEKMKKESRNVKMISHKKR